MKKIKCSIRVLLIIAFIFIVCILCNSADWLTQTFGRLDFSTVLYQLNSPMQGTGHEILNEYIINCLIKTILETIILLLSYLMIRKISQRLILQIKFNIFDTSKTFTLFTKKCNYILKIFLMSMVAIVLYSKVCQVGIPQYINKISHASSFYEQYYVAPDSVQIKFPEHKNNLIYIYMESMETTYASKTVGGGKDINYITNLTRLAEQNISFSDTDQLGGYISYGGTGWTMAALLASTSGVPYLLPIEGNSVGDYKEILPGLTTLGDILKDEGYDNYFMCGSDASFGGRKLYFEQHGGYDILDYYTAIEDGLISEDYYEFWGFEDSKLYQYAKNKLEIISQKNQPFNFTLLTVDTHHMNGYICNLCRNEYEEDYANVISCADRQILEFIDWIKQQDWYEDTTIVIVGDHTSMNNNFWDDLDTDYNRRVYNCFINTKIDKKNVDYNYRIFYSMDLFPTTLAALGAKIEGNRLGIGTNLFSDVKTIGEEIGQEEFETESLKYSKYYNEYFIGKSF